MGVSLLLKSSQELRVTLTVKFTVVSSSTLAHEPSELEMALGRGGGRKGWRDRGNEGGMEGVKGGREHVMKTELE